jgi:8-oxo-dGTP diphosphatase
MIDKFNIRVYGIFVNNKNEILLSDETYKNYSFTKFPGGGLEFGEGTEACLIREFKEELNIDILIAHHIYTTSFFQQSAFSNNEQIISIYYKVAFKNNAANNFEIINNIHNPKEQFRFLPFSKLTQETVTLPIDKIVVQMMLQEPDGIMWQ